MGEGRLSGLATLFIHNNIPADVDKIVDIYAAKSRRMLL